MLKVAAKLCRPYPVRHPAGRLGSAAEFCFRPVLWLPGGVELLRSARSYGAPVAGLVSRPPRKRCSRPARERLPCSECPAIPVS